MLRPQLPLCLASSTEQCVYIGHWHLPQAASCATRRRPHRKATFLAFPPTLGIAVSHCDQAVGFQGQTESLCLLPPFLLCPALLLRTDILWPYSLPWQLTPIRAFQGGLLPASSRHLCASFHRVVVSKGLPVSWGHGRMTLTGGGCDHSLGLLPRLVPSRTLLICLLPGDGG